LFSLQFFDMISVGILAFGNRTPKAGFFGVCLGVCHFGESEIAVALQRDISIP
jgi:hypothetical protein